jgi:hypothetical protein
MSIAVADLKMTTSADMTTLSYDLSGVSCCGQPGDPGNTLGVGKYCTMQSDCTTSGTFCVYAIQPAKHSYFCTKSCSGPTDSCGEGASCTQDSGSGLYGCVPNLCVTNPPRGCTN